MSKLVVLGFVMAAACFGAMPDASADHRSAYAAPQYHPAPQFHPIPQVHVNPGGHGPIYNHVGPGNGPHVGNLGPHGHPMVQGVHGWHETHNRTHLGAIPGAPIVGGGFEPGADFDTFVDSIDLSQPLIPNGPCTELCGIFGGVSISNDGAWGASWNYPTADGAQQSATNACVQRAIEPCANTGWVAGRSWLAGIHCDTGALHWGGVFIGNDAGAAITNAYRFISQRFGFAPDSCGIVVLISGDGSQQQFVGQE